METTTYVPVSADPLTVIAVWTDPEFGMASLTELTGCGCRGYCWKCRLRTAWRALRYGEFPSAITFFSREDFQKVVGAVEAAAPWPPTGA